jgi:hypothetical protein
MFNSSKGAASDAGLTLVEIVATVSIMSVVVGSVVMAMLGTQNVFLQSQLASRLNLRAQIAMDSIVEIASQALTVDPDFSPLKTTSGVNSSCLRFRLFQAIDATGQPVYDDQLKVFIYGPSAGASPSAGLIIGRGPDLATVHAAGKGADNMVGTPDDNTSAVISGGIPAVRLLIPSTFTPRTGTMFTLNVAPAPIGRLLTFTLRLNAQTRDGSFVRENDLVLSEQLALRQ